MMMKESRIIGVMLMKASRVSKIYEPLYSRITWVGSTRTSMAVDSSLVVSLITNKHAVGKNTQSSRSFFETWDNQSKFCKRQVRTDNF